MAMNGAYLIRIVSILAMSLFAGFIQVMVSIAAKVSDASIFGVISIDDDRKRILSEYMLFLFRSQLIDVSLSCIVAFSVAFICMKLMLPVAARFGLIDHPDGERKVHENSTPIIGGVGMLVGVTVSMLFSRSVSQQQGIYVAMVLMAFTGVMDDRMNVSFKVRFILQALATLCMIYYSGVVLDSFGDLLGSGLISTGMYSWVVTIFCVCGVINAINMMDGLDGLAGSLSLVAFISFGLLASISGRGDLLFLITAFSGAVAAFLYFNWHPARLFMGDGGSMAIGFVLAYLSLAITQQGSGVSPVAALMVLSLPVSDTVAVMLGRISTGKNPFKPDRSHLHHLLLGLGLSQKGVVGIMVALTAASSSAAIAATLYRVPDRVLFALWCTGFVSYMLVRSKTGALHRVVQRLQNRPSVSGKLDAINR